MDKKLDETLRCIKSYISKHGYPPSYREIAESLNLSSVATAHSRIQQLFKLGYLETDAKIGSSRAFRVKGFKFVEGS